MVPLKVIMRHEPSDPISQQILTKKDHLIQTAFFESSHETFCICIQIRRSRRQVNRVDSGTGKDTEKFVRIKRIPIIDEITFACEETIDGIGHVACDLCHPQPIRTTSKARYSTRRVEMSRRAMLLGYP